MPDEERLPKRPDLKEQVLEARSDLNRYYTGLAVGHDPTEAECLMHYSLCGGARDFRQRHGGTPATPSEAPAESPSPEQ